jgi:hypothetical protein
MRPGKRFGLSAIECLRRGMAIKFAGLYGKEVRVIGKNRETLRAGQPTESSRSCPIYSLSRTPSIRIIGIAICHSCNFSKS